MGRKSLQSGKATLAAAIVIIPVALPLVGAGGLLRAEEGISASFTISERLENVQRQGFSNNENEGFRSVTRLGFGLLSENQNQALSFNTGTDFVYNFSRSETEFEDPDLNLNYDLQTRNAGLSFDASYVRRDVEDSVFFDDLSNEFIISDDGRREIFSLRSALSLNRQGPITFDLNHFFSDSRFTGTTDPDLRDSTTNGLTASSSFRLSPVASLNATARWREQDQDGVGANDRTRTSFDVGGTYDISAVTTLSAGISYFNNESTTRTDNSGPGYRFGLSHDRPNGTYDFDISSRETINGNEVDARANRSYDLPRGTASIGFGLAKVEGFSIEPLISAGLNLDINNVSRISLDLSQASTVDNDDNETIRTRLSVSYSRELNEISSMSASFRFADENVLADNDEDTTSLRASLSYRRAVGDDWSLVSGYEYSTNQRNDREDRNSNTLFVSLEKAFSFRP
ncbi:hypothetical protein [uncultured Roseobacter sp.]|uniref:hypothetical protein n=1 Tax=uncultured Roseobacter sp. TaxID=114847 RepID=UPI002637C7B2|nr:hypothetical protein [uncultured Roseobacter sp.]